MNDQSLVSVIIIFLNAGKAFFEEAIASILFQTYKNWELLLVDDGSTEISTEIAKQYASLFPHKIRYLDHKGHRNRGMSATRNLGIQNAKGEYVAFLDADDIWLPQKLEKQVAILEVYPEAGMVYGSTQLWYSWTNRPEDAARDSQRLLGVKPDTLIQPPNLVPLFLQKKALAPSTCGVLIRRRVFDEVGSFEEKFRSLYEDQAFFAKVCSKVTVFVESGCWDRYRQHSDSCCHSSANSGNYVDGQPNSAHLDYLNWLEEYFLHQKIQDIQIWKALYKARWPYDHPLLFRLVKPFLSLFQNSVQRFKGFFS